MIVDLSVITDQFHVYLLPCHNLDFTGESVLHVTSDMLILRDCLDTDIIIAKWHLSTLRRYGQDDTKFVVEAGRLV